MSTKTSFKLLFYVNGSRPSKTGDCPIYLRITMNGKNIALTIKRSVKPEMWDTKTGKCIGRSPESKEINQYIDAYRNMVFNKHRELLAIYDDIFPELLRDYILGINTLKTQTLCDIWENHVKSLKSLIGNGTSYSSYQKSNTCLKYMREFLSKEYKSKDISIKLVNLNFVTKFDLFLRVNKKCCHNTAMKYLQNFKRIISIAIKNDWLRINPFADFKLSLNEVDRPFLTEKEIARIMKLDFSTKRLDIVRDLFLFSCFSGLSYSDLYKLKGSEIEADNDNRYWIRTRRQKTKVKSQIPLLEIPINILAKYTNLKELKADEKALPVPSNQKMNGYLKEIQSLAKIEKELTFHVARHTFATTVTMMHGVPIESVSRMLGHTNIRTTQHYARIVDAKIGSDMNILAQKLTGRFDFDQNPVLC